MLNKNQNIVTTSKHTHSILQGNKTFVTTLIGKKRNIPSEKTLTCSWSASIGIFFSVLIAVGKNKTTQEIKVRLVEYLRFLQIQLAPHSPHRLPLSWWLCRYFYFDPAKPVDKKDAFNDTVQIKLIKKEENKSHLKII